MKTLVAFMLRAIAKEDTFWNGTQVCARFMGKHEANKRSQTP
jgi:hypothetical protein